jgi:histidyl-tRNA synthetase
MKDEFLTLFDSAKALVAYIDNESVFDRAAAGGCSGMDFHLSDTFYDLIVNARKAINDVENVLEVSTTDGNKEKVLRLFDAAKALTTHVEKEHAFDKVNDMGSVGIETCQSEAFLEIIQKANDAIAEAEKRLN